MQQSRETIYSTLFALVSTSASFNTISRRLKHWDDVDVDMQPALYQTQRGESIVQQKGLPAKTHLAATLYIYAHQDDEYSSPSEILNPLLDAVTSLFTPDPVTGTFTMGLSGVSHCWIEGKIETDEGLFGNQSFAVIPVSILAY